MSSITSIGVHFKQYAMVAAGGLGLTGGRAPSGPLNAQIGISDPCNHECVFCWDHPPDDRANADTADRFGMVRAGVMALEQFERIVDDLYGMGTRRIDLIGRGEPLLNRAALDMVRYAKGRGMQLALVTNGSRLFEPIAKGLVAAGMDRVNVSLNAGTPETYPNIHVTETPKDYLKVKKNLRVLSDCKIAAGSDLPFVSLSFVITSKVQYRELRASLPAAIEKAATLRVQNNLAIFDATIPPYMPSEVVGPPVVPCYVGWYFTVILGNGSVMPCCQCAAPIDRVTDERRFADVWASREYADFRTAAKALPKKSERLMTCECDNCQLRPRNVALHNFLHPLNRIEAGQEVKKFSPKDFLRKMQGKHGHPPS